MRRLAAFLAALALLPAAAAEPEARWYLHMDNDSVLDTDRWYSSGLRIARVVPRGAYDLEVGLVQEVFTPESERFEFGVVDRAPTARLLLSVARHDRSPELFQTMELAVGVRGPSALGEEATDLMHRLVSAADIAWSRQEPDRFDGQFAFTRTHHLERVNLHYGAVVGNEIAFAHAGAELWFGTPGAGAPALRYAPTPPLNRGRALFSDGGDGASTWGFFVGASVRGVARNEMIGRPYSAFGAPLEKKDAVGRVAAGLAWSRPGLALGFAVVAESREFDGQRAPHAYASLGIHAGF